MESDSPQDARAQEDRDFEDLIGLIGGRQRIYLVSDPCHGGQVEEEDAGILQEFIHDLFPGSLSCPPCRVERTNHLCSKAHTVRTNHIPLTTRDRDPDPEQRPCPGVQDTERQNGTAQRTATRRANIYSLKRTIDSPVIIFIFRQTFVSSNSHNSSLKEILKDVRARTKHAAISRPALIGLIRTKQESAETSQCAQILDTLLRSVFHKHPPDTVWVDCFIPKTEATILSIKRNACKVINSSQTADNTRDRGNPLLRPFQCLFWPERKGARGQVDSSPTSRKRGDHGSTEENIPLKNSSLPAGPPTDTKSEGGDR